MKFSAIVPILPLTAQTSKVPAEFRPLHQYLHRRYADTVVLSFPQIESLLDGPLPELAFLKDWWVTVAPDGSNTAQSRSWTEANRTASPNFAAGNVVFERLPER